jgi:thiamine-monophosphate kinase
LPSEFELIRRYFQRPTLVQDGTSAVAILGIGDDAALLRPSPGMELAVSTDMLVEGRHFRAGADPESLGHKALAVNLSDLAAMGATPRWATLAIALPEANENWIAAFAGGLFALAQRFGTELVGGDTTRGPLCISITVVGEVPAGKALLRSGARPGEDIWVSGELGGAAIGLAMPQVAAAAARLNRPEPRVALGEKLRGVASAAIDVSDGFAQDLRHILEASGVGGLVRYESLPKFPHADAKLQRRCVLSGGDDYELVFTAPQAKRDAVAAVGAGLALPLARVGSVEKGNPELAVLAANGKRLKVDRGFDHFAA